MSIPNLPTNFKDDILNTSVNSKRKYRMINNSGGTVSFEDATEYRQTGSDFGAGQINATNDAINKIYSERILSLEEVALVTEPGFFVDAMVVSELIDKLKDTEWISVLSTTNVTVKYRVKNGLVTVVGQNSGNNSYKIPDGDYKSVTTIPEEYRPKFEIPFTFHLYGGGGTNLSGLIGTDGIIKLYQKGGSGNYWGFSFSYPV